MRILVLIAIGLLLYVIIGNLWRRSRPSLPDLVTEKMVKCEHCGLHILEQEAVHAGEHYYCSSEHLEMNQQSK